MDGEHAPGFNSSIKCLAEPTCYLRTSNNCLIILGRLLKRLQLEVSTFFYQFEKNLPQESGSPSKFQYALELIHRILLTLLPCKENVYDNVIITSVGLKKM